MGRREREDGAAFAAARNEAAADAALTEVCGEGCPPSLAATVAARALVALRLRDYQEAERSAVAAADALSLAIDASTAARERAALAEAELHEACSLYGLANDALRADREAGALVSYVPPAHRGDAWEPPAAEVQDGTSEEDSGNADRIGARAV